MEKDRCAERRGRENALLAMTVLNGCLTPPPLFSYYSRTSHIFLLFHNKRKVVSDEENILLLFALEENNRKIAQKRGKRGKLVQYSFVNLLLLFLLLLLLLLLLRRSFSYNFCQLFCLVYLFCKCIGAILCLYWFLLEEKVQKFEGNFQEKIMKI